MKVNTKIKLWKWGEIIKNEIKLIIHRMSGI